MGYLPKIAYLHTLLQKLAAKSTGLRYYGREATFLKRAAGPLECFGTERGLSMGRSSHEQAMQNRSKIVERASKLFRRTGVEAVSVADVMTATGMTAGGFYKHFASKDALVQEACSFSFEQASSFWAAVSKKSEEAGVSAAAVVRAYFTKRPRDEACPMLAFAAHATSAASGPLARAAYRAGAKRLFTQFVARKRNAREQEAKVIFAAMIGAGFLAHALGDEKWVRDVQQAVENHAMQE